MSRYVTVFHFLILQLTLSWTLMSRENLFIEHNTFKKDYLMITIQ